MIMSSKLYLSKPSPYKLAACLVLPVVIIGLRLWLSFCDKDEGEEKEVPHDGEGDEYKSSTEKKPVDALSSKEKGVPHNCEGGEDKSSTEKESLGTLSSTTPTSVESINDSLVRVEVRASGEGKGRGLFCAQGFEAGETVCCLRPALVMLFQPHCYTHCIGCFADLHTTPGRRCGECERFAVSHCIRARCFFVPS